MSLQYYTLVFHAQDVEVARRELDESFTDGLQVAEVRLKNALREQDEKMERNQAVSATEALKGWLGVESRMEKGCWWLRPA
jgi:hypothetical protein